MEEPRSWIVGPETNGNIVASTSNIDNIALDGVVVVVDAAASTSDHAEGMTVKMEWMLQYEESERFKRSQRRHSLGQRCQKLG